MAGYKGSKFVRVKYRTTLNVNKTIRAMRVAETRAIDRMLQQAVQIAKARCPYDTGRLMRSIRILRSATDRAKGIVGRMGSLMPYANKANLRQRNDSGRGYMDTARASLVGLKKALRREWAQSAQKRLK